MFSGSQKTAPDAEEVGSGSEQCLTRVRLTGDSEGLCSAWKDPDIVFPVHSRARFTYATYPPSNLKSSKLRSTEAIFHIFPYSTLYSLHQFG